MITANDHIGDAPEI